MRSTRAKEINDHVGKRIRTRRQAKGMTQKQLGDATGVTLQQIQKYEKGVDTISVPRLTEIAESLDTAPAGLLPSRIPTDGDGEDDPSQLLNSPEDIRMARAFKKVCGKWRPLLLYIVEGCADRLYPSCDE